MRTVGLLAITLALSAMGCLRRTPFSNCHDHADCAGAGPGARCETDGACSIDSADCASHRAYASSAPNPGACVAAGVPDAAADGAPDAAPDGRPTSMGRECVKGGPRTADTTCAADICAKEPRCCSQQWDAVCVRWAESLCGKSCSSMAFVGGGQFGVVVRTDTWEAIWDDHLANDSMTHGGYWADYDDDGDVDLATVGGRQLHVYRNDGFDGTHLKLVAVYSKDWQQLGFNYLDGRAGTWADWDGDGDLDLTLGGFDGVVMIENDAGVFLNERVLFRQPLQGDTDAMPPPGNSTTSLGWADVDGDHDLDLVVGNYYTRSQLFTNSGDGTMTLSSWVGPVDAETVQWCNLDGDPDPELVMSGAGLLTIYDLTGQTIEPDELATHVQTVDALTETKCADLDHDGDLDLFSATWGSTPRAYRNANGTLAGFSEAWRDGTAMPYQWGLDVGDVDGDGRLDALAAGNAFEQPMVVRRYQNLSTNMNQNIAFGEPTTLGAAYAVITHDIELAPLPPVTP